MVRAQAELVRWSARSVSLAGQSLVLKQGVPGGDRQAGFATKFHPQMRILP
jgi:hypothetical protein